MSRSVPERAGLRRGWWRRSGTAVAAVVAVAVAVAVVVVATWHLSGGEPPARQAAPSVAAAAPAATGPPVPPPLTAATGTRLLVVQNERLDLLDVDTGASTRLPLDPRLGGHARLLVLPVGDELVLAGNSSTGAGSGAETVLVTTAGPGSPLREIGTATGLHPSSEPGRFWLETQLMPPDEPRTLLRLVDLQGVQHRAADHDGSARVLPLGGGYLRLDRAGTELVDRTGRRLRRYQQVGVLGLDAHSAVLGSSACAAPCPIRVLRADGDVEGLALELRSGVLDHAVALSPDRRTLLSADSRAGHTVVTSHDLAEPTAGTRVDGAWSTTIHGFSPQFSSDSRWAFWPDVSGRSVNALDVVTGRPFRVPGEFASVEAVIVLP
jgi:hypothetical protein